MAFLNRFLTISASDPDDIRRRRILNILIVSIGVLSILALLASIAAVFLRVQRWDNVSLVVFGSAATILGLLIIYLINYFWSGKIAATIFLTFLTILFAFTDTPEQVSGGRSLFAFAIPIIIASIILVPWSSFI